MTDAETLAELYLDRIDFAELESPEELEDAIRGYARLRAEVDRDLMVYGFAFVELLDDDLERLDPTEARPDRDDVVTLLEDGDADAVYGAPPLEASAEALRDVRDGLPSMWVVDEDRLERARDAVLDDGGDEE